MEEMKKQAEELIQQAYNRGYKVGKEEGRKDGYEDWKNSVFNDVTIDAKSFIEQGRDEAWEAVKKLYLSEDFGGLPVDVVRKIFGIECEWLSDIFKKYSASEVIDKLRKYEEQTKEEDEKNNEFKVGDVVKLNDHSAVITWCDGDHWNGICVQGTDSSQVGMTYCHIKYDDWTKTGETIPEIVKMLKK